MGREIHQKIHQVASCTMTRMPAIAITAGLCLASCMAKEQTGEERLPDSGDRHSEATGPQNDHTHPLVSPGLAFVNYRNLQGGHDGVVLVDLDPESQHFGAVLQQRGIGPGVLPHHLYFNRDESRLYTTALGGAYLYEIILDAGVDGLPIIHWIEPIETTSENQVGENMYFTRDGSRFYMTFLGGNGSLQGGSVGVFDAHTNELIETVVAPVPADPSSGQPLLLYPHGISANEDLGLMMVTSTIHPDLISGIGNTVTAIDLATNQVQETYLVADSASDLSSPVEVLLLRDDLPPYALVTTMLGGDIWLASYEEETKRFGSFSKVVEGDDHGVGWALELYIHENCFEEKELYVSFASPGVIHVYSLESLPSLPLVRTLPAAAGAHHMMFFKTASGREVVAVQNNLLNLPDLNEGTLMVVDIYTGAVVDTLDLAGLYGLMPEAIESAFGHGHAYHH